MWCTLRSPWCESICRVKLRGVHHTAESSDPNFSKNSAVCITPQAPRTAELEVCLLLRSPTLRCASHCGVKLHTVHTLRSQNWNLWESLVAFEGQTGEILSGVNTSIMKEKIWRTFFWFAKPKILTPRCHAHPGVKILNFVIEYLGEIETEFKNTLACLLGAQMGPVNNL